MANNQFIVTVNEDGKFNTRIVSEEDYNTKVMPYFSSHYKPDQYSIAGLQDTTPDNISEDGQYLVSIDAQGSTRRASFSGKELLGGTLDELNKRYPGYKLQTIDGAVRPAEGNPGEVIAIPWQKQMADKMSQMQEEVSRAGESVDSAAEEAKTIAKTDEATGLMDILKERGDAIGNFAKMAVYNGMTKTPEELEAMQKEEMAQREQRIKEEQDLKELDEINTELADINEQIAEFTRHQVHPNDVNSGQELKWIADNKHRLGPLQQRKAELIEKQLANPMYQKEEKRLGGLADDVLKQAQPHLSDFDVEGETVTYADPEVKTWRAARYFADKAKTALEAPNDNDNGFTAFLKGNADTFKEADFWMLGLESIASNLKAKKVLDAIGNKINNYADQSIEKGLSDGDFDSLLTDAEKELLISFVTASESQALRALNSNNMYNAGKISAESLGFMAQFILTGGVGDAFAAGTKTAAKSLALWLAKKLGKTGTKLAIGAAVASNTLVGRGALKAADAIATPLLKAVPMTLMQTGLYKDYAQKLTERDQRTGELVYDYDTAVLPALRDAGLEVYSEMALAPLLSVFGKTMGVGLDRLAGKAKVAAFLKTKVDDITKFFHNREAMDILTRAGYDGYFEEIGEEIFGAGIRSMWEPEAWSQFWEHDNIVSMAVAFAPMSVIGGGMSMANYIKRVDAYNAAVPAVQDMLARRGMSPALIDEMFSRETGTMQDIADKISGIVNPIVSSGNITADEFKALWDFAGATAQKDITDSLIRRVEEDRRSVMRNRMTQQMNGKSFMGKDESGNETVSFYTDEKGNRRYVIVDAENKDGLCVSMDENGKDMKIVDAKDVELTTMKADAFFDEQWKAQQAAAEQQRMQQESVQQRQAVNEALKGKRTIQLYNETAGQMEDYIFLGWNGQSAIVANAETGNEEERSVQALANALNVDSAVLTDAQKQQAQVDEFTRNDSMARSANDYKGAPVDFNGVVGTLLRMTVKGDESGNSHIVASVITNEGQVVPVNVTSSMVDEFIQGRKEQLAAGNVEAEDRRTKDNQRKAQQQKDSEAYRSSKAKYTNADGTVREGEFLNADPRGFAMYSDSKYGKNDTDATLNAALANAQAKAQQALEAKNAEANPDAKKKLRNEYDKALTDLDILDKLIAERQSDESSSGRLSPEAARDKYSEFEELGLSDAEITELAMRSIAEAQERIAALPKPEVSTDVKSYMEQKQKYAEAVAAEQKKVDYWVSILDAPMTESEKQNLAKADARMQRRTADILSQMEKTRDEATFEQLDNELKQVASGFIGRAIDDLDMKDVPTVITSVASVERDMREANSSDTAIASVLNAIARGRQPKGFFDKASGKMFLIADYNTDIAEARTTFVHERQHSRTMSRGLVPVLMKRLGLSGLTEEQKKAILLPELHKLVKTDFYDGKSSATILDEIISFAVENEFNGTLDALGVNDIIVKFAKNIDNEQGQTAGIPDTGNLSDDDGSYRVTDQGNEREESGESGALGEQGSGSAGRSGQEVNFSIKTDIEKKLVGITEAMEDAESLNDFATWRKLSEQKRGALQNTYDTIGLPVTCANLTNLAKILDAKGYSQSQIKEYEDMVAAGLCGANLQRKDGTYDHFEFTDFVASGQELEIGFHECQHAVNDRLGAQFLEGIMSAMNYDFEEMLKFVNVFAEDYNTISFYRERANSISRIFGENEALQWLANECVARAMGQIYTGVDVASKLRSGGISEQVINEIKNIEDGQKQSSLAKASRKLLFDFDESGNNEKNGRAAAAQSGNGRTGSLEESQGDDYFSGRGSSEGLREESNGGLTPSIEQELADKGLVMDGGVVMAADLAALKKETGYLTPNEITPEEEAVAYSVRTKKAWADNYRKYPGSEERVVRALENLAERLTADELVNGVISQGNYKYGKKANGSFAGPLRTNIEYVVTFDMDTTCPRTFQYLNYVKQIEKRIGRPLTQTECIQLTEMMRMYGQQIPCVYCYSENKRQAMKQYYTDFMTARQAVLNAETDEEALAAMYGHATSKEAKESNDPAVALNEAAYKVFLNWRANRKTAYNPSLKMLWMQYSNDRNVVLTVLDQLYSDGKIMTDLNDDVIAAVVDSELRINDAQAIKVVEDIVSEWKWDAIEGREHSDFTPMEEDDLVVDPRTLSLWREMTAYAKSASQAKSVLRYVPYTDELKKLSQEQKDYINGMGGVRMHSSNDFRIDYVFDYFQFMADMAANKMFGHTYTKSPEFVRIFGNSGYKINMSIAAYEDEKGTIRMNEDEGFNWDEAKKLRMDFPNAGVMLMATSDNQIQMALDEDWIDMFIPFHASSLPKAVWYNMRMWQDYSTVQNEAFLNGDEMKAALIADGVELPKKIKAADVEKMYLEHFGIKSIIGQTGKKKGKRLRPHFLPGPTVVDGQYVPGHNNDHARYLELCREYGVHPRFFGIKVKDNTPEGNGRIVDITEHPAYIKCIKETSRTDSPQTPIQFNFDQPSEALGGKTPMEYAFTELKERAAKETELAGQPVRDIYKSLEKDTFGIVPQFIDTIIKHKETTGKDYPLDYLTPDSRDWFLTQRRALEAAYKDVETIPYHRNEYDIDGEPVMARVTEEEQAEINKALDFINGVKTFSEEDGDIRFSVRTKPAPKNTGIGYKVFFLKDGKLYPPMVANPNGADTPVGVWLDADAAPQSGTSKTGRMKVKAGGKGTQGGTGSLAYRPGWHLGEIPYALQFNRGPKVDNPLGITGKNGKVIKVGSYFPANFVWAEVEYAKDVNYQEEAMSYGYNGAGNFQHSLAGLPRVPEDGSYTYRTNANPATDPWIITGAMKVNRILSDSEVDELVRDAGREPQKREENAKAFEERMAAVNGQQKKVDGNYADAAELDDIMFRLSNNNRATISKWFDKWVDAAMKGASNPEAGRTTIEPLREKILDYLDKFNDATMQLAWAKWFFTGSVRMGAEDMPKVRQAIKIAKLHKVDPLQYDSPMSIINQWPGDVKEEPINPDDVPNLRRAKELADGIVIYDIDESKGNLEESRKILRQIINTHFGKDCSPWCLLQGDGKGNLTAQSMHYWAHYSSYPKQIAFQNGKLFAFSANDSRNRVWWDKQDICHNGLPASGKLADGKLFIGERNMETGEIEGYSKVYKGNKKDGYYAEYDPENPDVLILEENRKDGKLEGERRVFFIGGLLNRVENFKEGVYEGKRIGYYENGNMMFESDMLEGQPTGEYRSYHENGALESSGRYERGDKVGEWTFYYEDGQLSKKAEYEVGRWRPTEEVSYYPDGSKKSETHSVSRPYAQTEASEMYWDEKGRLVKSKRLIPSEDSYGYADRDFHEVKEVVYGEVVPGKVYTIERVSVYRGPNSDANTIYSSISGNGIMQTKFFRDPFAYKGNNVIYDESYKDGELDYVKVQKYEKYDNEYMIDSLYYMFDKDGNVKVRHTVAPRKAYIKNEDYIVNEYRELQEGETIPRVDDLYKAYLDKETKGEGTTQSKSTPEEQGSLTKKSVEERLSSVGLYMDEDMGGDVTIGGTINGVEYPYVVFDEDTYEDFLANGYEEDELGLATEEQRAAYAAVEDEIYYYQTNGYWRDEAVAEDEPMFRVANENQRVFVSNAAKALDKIPMKKGNAQAWINKLQQAGGLKKEEDKWLGLSEWLKEQKGDISKEDVAKFIQENQVQIEEVHYTDDGDFSSMDKKYPGFSDAFEMGYNRYDGRILMVTNRHEALSLYEQFGDGLMDVDDMEAGDLVQFAKSLLDKEGMDRPINSTRRDFSTEGLMNKREIALTVPTIEPYREDDDIHFGDAGKGRAVAWVRFGETGYHAPEKLAAALEELNKYKRSIGLDGMLSVSEYMSVKNNLSKEQADKLRELEDAAHNSQRVLVIDEVQSKRHQDGKEKGYIDYAKVARELKDYNESLEKKYGPYYEERMNMEERMAQSELVAKKTGVPDAPFRDNWHELAMKRMLRLAAEEGYDKIAWTNGDMQADRYNIGGVVKSIYADHDNYDGESHKYVSINLENGGNLTLEVDKDGIVERTESSPTEYDGKPLSSVIGKELADKIVNLPQDVPSIELGEQDLRIGGEGMRFFYDQKLVNWMNKYGKQWGVSVNDLELDGLDAQYGWHSIDVTPEMKESVMDGQVMFRATEDVKKEFAPRFAEVRDEYEQKKKDILGHDGRFTHEEWKEHKDELIRIGNERDARLKALQDEYAKAYEEAEEEDKRNAPKYDTVGERNEERGKALFDAAKEAFGTTDNFMEAGYIVPDGSMIDLSGKNNGGEPGRRQNDHRDINSVINDRKYATATEYMDDFINEGAIRIAPEVGLVSLANKPTKEQREILRNYLYRYSGEGVEVELLNGSKTAAHPTYRPRTAPSRILGDIENYFDQGVIPAGNEPMFRSVEITPETRDEMAQIEAIARVKGTYLKAPNGADTKLNPEQWAMVRTKAFRDWFGDWINDPKNASKVVDENGEPMVVYHGSDFRPILEDTGVFKARHGMFGKAVYFTNDFNEASEYADMKLDMADNRDYLYAPDKNDFIYDNGYITEAFLNIRDEERIHDMSSKKEGMMYYAAAPSEIKSATDNNGEFSGDNDDIRYRTIPGGESMAERTYRETGAFSFTGSEKISSIDDVAFIFRELENYATENSFLVLVKDGVPTILHTGIGDVSSTAIDLTAAIAGYNDFKPDVVYMVHNHPSGNLHASKADRNMLDKLVGIFDGTPVEGVILDTVSGNYGVFDEWIDTEKPMPESGDEYPVKVLSFDRQVFDKDFRSQMAERKIAGSADVAAFLSAHRLGEGNKLGALLLNHNNIILANYVTNDNLLSEKNAKDVAKQVANAAVHNGATSTILFGNFNFNSDSLKAFHDGLRATSGGELSILDVVQFDKDGDYRSVSDENLKGRKDGVMFSVNELADTSELNEAGKKTLDELFAISNQIYSWLVTRKSGQSMRISLPSYVTKRIKSLINVEDVEHRIQSNDAIHGFKNHGIGGRKLQKDSIPLGYGDIALMPFVMYSPDYIDKGSFTDGTLKSVRYYKTLSNGTMVVVERENIKDPDVMSNVTMWASYSPSNVPDAHTVVSPGLDVRSVVISADDVAKIVNDTVKAIAIETNDVNFRIGPAAEMKKKGIAEFLTDEQRLDFTNAMLNGVFSQEEFDTITESAFENGGSYFMPVLEHLAGLAEKADLDAHDLDVIEKARQEIVSLIGAKDETLTQNDMLWVAYDAVNGGSENVWNQMHNRRVKRTLDEAASVAPEMSLSDYLAKAAEAKDDIAAQYTAMRELASRLTSIMDAMSVRRDYDRVTVGKLVSLAEDVLTSKLMDNATNGEIKRLAGIIRKATGMRNIQSRVNELYNLILTNNLRRLKGLFEKELKRKAVKIDGNNVVNQGALDINGQIAMTALKENLASFSEDESGNIVISQSLADKISDALSRASEAEDPTKAEMELLGLSFARRYIQDVVASEKEEQQLRDAMKDADEALSKQEMTPRNHAQFIKEQTRALAECRAERVEKFMSLLQSMQDLSAASHELAVMVTEKDKERIEQIHHDANSDMEGTPSDEHPKDLTFMQKISNNSFFQFFFRPLATFDQMLRLFGNKSVAGEGYLWNRFMRGWIDATGKEYKAVQAAFEVLDNKVSEVFGKKMRWSDLYSVEARMPKATCKFWDGGQMKDHELTQGNLLYIMLADQMTDGRMKLRAMGISEEDVDAIREQMDPRFLTLADWVVNEFLPSRREVYNAVHERMFGAPMSKVENYFPLKVLANARTQQVDVASANADPSTPSTVTGSIMKRTRNALALDVMGTDAFSLVVEHVQKMEHWAAFAEWNRDLSDLLSYKHFRNQVQNMTSIYGSGRNLWTEFVDAAMIAAGSYKGKSGKLDPAFNRMAKGVTAAKISLRVFTAIKQFLSFPAYFSEANPIYLAEGFVKGWNWSMDNLPLFEKRWKSRQAGDHILAEGNLGKINEYLARIGMTPNALVDAFTVSIGSYAIYKTKYDKYIKMGFSEAAADKKAKQDAVILYNETQQSSEAAFMSSMQSGRTSLEKMFTVFRNSSMGYQRQVHDALRNYKHRLATGYRKVSIEFMTKQLVREGLSDAQALKAARGMYERQGVKDALRLSIFGYGLQFFWSLAPYLPYLLFGDDDDKKKEMLTDAAEKGVFGSLEGLTGGNLMSEAGNLLVFGEGLNNWDPSLLPLVSDFTNLYQEFGKDNVRAINDLINLGIQVGIGVNPQTLEDGIVAVIDACNGDLGTAKEALLLGLRLINAPQTSIDQLYLDEIDMDALEAKGLSIPELAARYAQYKKMKGAGAMAPLYNLSPELSDKVTAKYEGSFEDKAKARLSGIESEDRYTQLAEEAKAMDARVKELRKKAKEGDEDAERELMDIFMSPDYGSLMMFDEMSKDVKEAIKNAVTSSTVEEMRSYLDEADALRTQILDNYSDQESSESWFRGKYTQYTKGFLPEMARLEKKYEEEYVKTNPKYEEWRKKHQEDINHAAEQAKTNAERVAEIDAELKKYEIVLPNGKKKTFNQPARKKLQEEKKRLKAEGVTEKAFLNRLKKQEKFTPEDFMPPAIYNSPEFQTYLEFKSMGSVNGNRFNFKAISEWESRMNEADDFDTKAKYREMINDRMVLLGQQITRSLNGVDDDDEFYIPEDED